MDIFNNLLPIIKDAVLEKIGDNSEVPADKKDLIVDVASNSLAKGFTDNIGDLAGLFTGNSSTGSSITDNIQNSVINSLVEKTGLGSGAASSIISGILPLVIDTLKNKFTSGGTDGFDLGEIVESISKGSESKGGLGNVLKSIGKMFG